MADETRPTYTFGDNPRAGDRLDLLARVFEPSSAALLGRAGSPRPSLAIDLGCGPGHTTRLVASVTGATRTIGLDQSASFVERARVDAPAGVEFAVHDATETPFPLGPPDLIFARYLLAHLPQPLDTAARWAGALAPGGRLVLEEVDSIATPVPTFEQYLDHVADMIASRGGDLYVGKRLAGPLERLDDGTIHSTTAEIAPPTANVARMFVMNLDTWRDDPWTTGRLDGRELEQLRDALVALEASPAIGEIVWTHRQVIYERVA